MAGFVRYEEIEAWRAARELVGAVGQCVRSSKELERNYAIRDQLLRAAVSTMSNIAEGFGRGTNRDFAHFLDIARGSAYETQSLFYVLLDLGYATQEQFTLLYKLADRASVLIASLARYLRRNAPYRSDHVAEPAGSEPSSDLRT